MLGNSGVIMAQCYGIMLQFQGSWTRGSAEHPGSADLSRMMQSEASEVIGSVQHWDGDVKPIMAPMGAVLGG